MTSAVTLKVSAKSNPNAVAGALAGALRERDSIELQAVGAGAINQAVKSTACCAELLANFVLRTRAAPRAMDRETAAYIAGNSSQALPSSDARSVVPRRCASNRRMLQERIGKRRNTASGIS